MSAKSAGTTLTGATMSTDSSKTTRRRAFLVGIPLLALGTVATVAVAAPGASMGQDGPGFRGHHGPHGHHAELDSVDDLRDRMDVGVRFLGSQVDTTEAQEAEMEAILDELAPVAWELRTEGRALRAEVRDSLDGGDVDAEALEQARQDGLDLADRASALMLDTFVDISEVLTPEQRIELADLHARWHR